MSEPRTQRTRGVSGAGPNRLLREYAACAARTENRYVTLSACLAPFWESPNQEPAPPNRAAVFSFQRVAARARITPEEGPTPTAAGRGRRGPSNESSPRERHA